MLHICPLTLSIRIINNKTKQRKSLLLSILLYKLFHDARLDLSKPKDIFNELYKGTGAILITLVPANRQLLNGSTNLQITFFHSHEQQYSPDNHFQKESPAFSFNGVIISSVPFSGPNCSLISATINSV